MESCESPQGVMVYQSLGGGACGMASEFLMQCWDHCSGQWKMTCLLYPNLKTASNVLEPYNTVLSHDGIVYNSSFTIMYDNY